MSGFSKRNKNKHNRSFTLLFTEQTYTGAPRTFSNAWNRYQRTIRGKHGKVLDREPGVRKSLRYAHDWGILFKDGDAEILWTCINPTCAVRGQELWGENHIRRKVPVFERATAREKIRDELLKVAAARDRRLSNSCPSCGRKIYPYGVSKILHKWVYILKKSGDSLQPYQEIEFDGDGNGKIASRFVKGEFRQRRRRQTGPLIRLPRADIYEWHFFLSPVRLRNEALALLAESPARSKEARRACKAASPEKSGVSYRDSLQPWTTTCARKFSRQALTKKSVEIVPLVDPFAWVAQIVDFDYAPILAAQQRLARDPEEQAKAFISSTLKQAIGREMISENPPKWTDTDRWDVADETVPKPYGASGDNIADAWIKRYRDTLKYLSVETDKACARLVFTLRYSLAHRVVELACQEAGDEPGHLSLALTHWTHVLREMAAADTGARFIAWLTDPKAGSGVIDAAVRVPHKNVLQGAGIKGQEKIAKEADGLPVLILASITPGVFAHSNDPIRDTKKYLDNINLKSSVVKVPGAGDVLSIAHVQSAKNLGVSIAKDVLQKYVEKMPQSVDFAKAHGYTVAKNWQDRLKAFDTLGKFESIVSLFGAMKAFSKRPARYGNEYEPYKNAIGKVKAAKTVAEFIAKSSRDVLSYGMSANSKTAVATLEKKGRNALSTLSRVEYNALMGSRVAKTYRLMGSGLRVLSGPVGILIGGAELVVTSGEILNSWDANDPGGGIGQGMQLASGVMFIAIAGAECAALVTGAGVASWAGPVGWIAAGLMLIGSIVISVWSKNDLELFANHCFLGKEYGDGANKSGKAWLAGRPYRELRFDGVSRARDRFQRQRLALLRLLSGYRTWIGPATVRGVSVFPSFVLPTMCFQVEIDVVPKGRKSPKDQIRFHYWPHSGETVLQKGRVSISKEKNHSFVVVGEPENVLVSLCDYEIRVRLDLAGSGRDFLPASKSWVKNGTRMKGDYSIYKYADSASTE